MTTKRFSEICERNMDTITAALHQAALEVEGAEVDGYHVAVSIDAEGNVHTFPCPYGTIPPSVRDGGELIIRRFCSGTEFAPEGWADSVDWAAEAALYIMALRQWEREAAEMEAEAAC